MDNEWLKQWLIALAHRIDREIQPLIMRQVEELIDRMMKEASEPR